MSPAVIALLVAGVSAFGAMGAAWVVARSSTKQTAQSAVTKTLDEVWRQRVIFRDEQIESLRVELRELRKTSEAANKKLSQEVQRLTELVIALGGSPDEQ